MNCSDYTKAAIFLDKDDKTKSVFSSPGSNYNIMIESINIYTKGLSW